MNKYLALGLVVIGSYVLGYLIGKRQGIWNTLMNSTGLWGQPKQLTLIKGGTKKPKNWRGLRK